MIFLSFYFCFFMEHFLEYLKMHLVFWEIAHFYVLVYQVIQVYNLTFDWAPFLILTVQVFAKLSVAVLLRSRHIRIKRLFNLLSLCFVLWFLSFVHKVFKEAVVNQVTLILLVIVFFFWIIYATDWFWLEWSVATVV